MTLRIGTLAVLLLAVSPLLHAQCKETPITDNKELAERKVLFDDFHLNKEYKKTLPHLKWLLTNYPAFSSNVYIKGAEILEDLASKEKDKARKRVYADSLMIVYDLRMKNCGEIPNVMNRKALYYFYYNYDSPQPTDMIPLFDDAIRLNGKNTMIGILQNYMKALMIYQKIFKKLSDDEILERYDKVNQLIEEKVKGTSDEANKKKYRDLIQENSELLITVIGPDKINCDFVRTHMGPKFKQNPKDIDNAKRIVIFMLKAGCTDDPLWLQAAEVVYEAEKDFGLGKNIGIKYLSAENYPKADFYLDDILKHAQTNEEKADVYQLKGTKEAKLGNKAAARENYLKALSLDANRKELWEKIGDLYASSFDDCARKQHQAEDRLIYLIAYDLYQRAGNTTKMNSMKQFIPSKEEIFELNWNVGDKKTIDCWIHEDTIIRTRD